MNKLLAFNLQIAAMHTTLILLQLRTYTEAVTGAGNWWVHHD